MKYNCSDCVNINSPLCELCTRVSSPSGKERKPKYYIRSAVVADTVSKYTIAPTITMYVGRRVPIPLKLVLDYNELFEPKEE